MLMTVVCSSAMQDEEAKRILDEVSAKTRSYQTISADFTFTMDNKEMNIHEENKGSIQLKGKKYLVNLPDVGMKIYSDGVSVWNYMEDGNQVTISAIDSENNELMDPSALFNLYEQGFDSKYIGEKKINNKIFHELELYPNEDEHEVSKISLLVDKSKMMISSATLFGTDDNLYKINIIDFKTNVDLPDSYFEFNAGEYDDLEVIDFR